MPDRHLRLLTLPPQSPQGGERIGVLLRERPTSPPDAAGTPSGGGAGDQDRGGGSSQGAGGGPSQGAGGGEDRGASGDTRDDNPFAAPPEGTPDRPWQPRRPADGEGADGSQGAQGGQGGQGPGSGGDGSPWGNQWSDQQPGRSPGGFGERLGGGQGTGPEGPSGGGPGTGKGTRWDPTDPVQRHARYALLSGMWAFFFAIFSLPYLALPLGALAMYWSISALRAQPRTPDPDKPAPAQNARSQTTSAVSGLVTASLAIVLVAASFTAKLVYADYYTCTNDALTNAAEKSCADLLPKELRGVLGTED
ncbi:hypothetical protein ABZ027_15380 [Streptomyces sp. NPDC006332]|uniref:hypothetical protein n=1 Tax=Streptomyces sp. NPDC006332 TaxID=3155456 RepID=UPI0033B6406D